MRSNDAIFILDPQLLPTASPDLPGLSFAWAFKPCEELAGDILDVFQLDEEHVGFYLLDVSGHGVVAEVDPIGWTTWRHF